MKTKILLFLGLSLFLFNVAKAQTVNMEVDLVKVTNVSAYSDMYKYTFGNPIKLNGNRKSGFAAGVMSLFVPGLGQFYNGDEVGGCAYVLAGALAKVWLICPPTAVKTYNYLYSYEEANYTAPIIANLLVAVVSVVDAAIVSKRVNKAREGYLIGGQSYLRVDPALVSGVGLGSNDLGYGLSCSLRF